VITADTRPPKLVSQFGKCNAIASDKSSPLRERSVRCFRTDGDQSHTMVVNVKTDQLGTVVGNVRTDQPGTVVDIVRKDQPGSIVSCVKTDQPGSVNRPESASEVNSRVSAAASQVTNIGLTHSDDCPIKVPSDEKIHQLTRHYVSDIFKCFM